MLVVCRKISQALENLVTCEFELGHLYRHLEITEGKETQHLIFGVVFDNETFNECFLKYDKITINRVNKTAFISDGKVITKKEFKEIANVVKYGRGVKSHNIVFVGNPRENCFMFHTLQGMTKIKALKFAYDTMLELSKGDISSFNSNRVTWLYTGIPIVYVGMFGFIDKQYSNSERYHNAMQPSFY